MNPVPGRPEHTSQSALAEPRRDRNRETFYASLRDSLKVITDLFEMPGASKLPSELSPSCASKTKKRTPVEYSLGCDFERHAKSLAQRELVALIGLFARQGQWFWSSQSEKL
jgi:hypothetical protein